MTPAKKEINGKVTKASPKIPIDEDSDEEGEGESDDDDMDLPALLSQVGLLVKNI